MIETSSEQARTQLADLPIASVSGLQLGLLLVWFVASFGLVFFANSLQQIVAGWPVSYWFAAQGSVLVFIGVVALFAWIANRRDRQLQQPDVFYDRYRRRIHQRFATYIVLFLVFLLALAAAEQAGFRKIWVGAVFLFATVFLYALIGIYGRTSKATEYYVAGRKIPPIYNGMAVAADWMSAASFISMAGGLYLQGFSGAGSQPGGLVYVLGWTGGFCLVALLVAPYLRSLNLYTHHCGVGCRLVFVHLRCGTNLWGGLDHIASDWCAVRNRHIAGAWRGSGVFVPGWDACRDLDPGDAVCGADNGISDSGVLAGVQTTGQPVGASGLWAAIVKNR